MRFVLAAVAGAVLFAVSSMAAEAPTERLAPHRAVYDVTLDEASERSGITSLSGRMVYESRGAACDGFSVRFRFFQNVRTARREYSSDQRTSTFESGDGKRLEFVNRTFFNGIQEREVKGAAVRDENGVAVALEQPAERALELPPAMFPSQHLAAVLDAAANGRRIYVADVYDGSDDGDANMFASAAIGRPRPVGAGPAPEGADEGAPSEGRDKAIARLADLRSWPVSVAYFSGAPGASGERLPAYQVSFPLYENGVSGDLRMRYEDYFLRARLADLTYLDPPDCAN